MESPSIGRLKKVRAGYRGAATRLINALETPSPGSSTPEIFNLITRLETLSRKREQLVELNSQILELEEDGKIEDEIVCSEEIDDKIALAIGRIKFLLDERGHEESQSSSRTDTKRTVSEQTTNDDIPTVSLAELTEALSRKNKHEPRTSSTPAQDVHRERETSLEAEMTTVLSRVRDGDGLSSGNFPCRTWRSPGQRGSQRHWRVRDTQSTEKGQTTKT